MAEQFFEATVFGRGTGMAWTRDGAWPNRPAGGLQPANDKPKLEATEDMGNRFGTFAFLDGRNCLSATPFEFRSGNSSSA